MNVRAMILLAAGLVFQSVFGQETFYWTGGSGNWSDVGNWYLDEDGTRPASRYPGGVTNTVDGTELRSTDDVVFFAPAAAGTVYLDVDVSIYRFSVLASKTKTEMTFESDAENPRKLTLTTPIASSIASDTSIRGNRTVTFRNILVKGTSFDFRGGDGIFDTGANIDVGAIMAWYNGGCLIRYLDGCRVDATLDARHINGTHLIEGGTVTGKISPNSQHLTIRIMGGTCDFDSVTLKSNSVFEVTGGDVTISEMKVPGTSSLMISGGQVLAEEMPAIDPDASVVFTNGLLSVAETLTDPRLLGKDNSVFRSTVNPTDGGGDYKSNPSIDVVSEDGVTVKCATVFATNGQYSAFHLTNDATVVAKELNLTRFTIHAAKDVVLKADRMNLGSRLYPTVDGASLTVPDGITLGAFGDWSVHDKTFTFNLGGEVTFDTIDCFDGVTPRYPEISKVVALPDLNLTVTGTGGLKTVFSSLPGILPRLAVDDGASLTFVNNNDHLVVSDFSMGENSRLNLKCNMGTLDVVSATIDPTAEISVLVNEDLPYAAYPVMSSQNDETAAAIAANTVLVGDGAADYQIRTCANCVYLSNGTEPEYGETGSSNIWTGAVSDDWNDAGNWTSGTVPFASDRNDAVAAYMNGTRNTDITNMLSDTAYVSRIMFLDECGPFRISGGKFILVSNGYRNAKSSPIYSLSDFPVIIESDIETRNALSTVAARDSYIALNGTTEIRGLFRPCGEVRVGGDLTCGTGILMELRTGSGRYTKMHVLPGGTVTATCQITNQVRAATRYVVDAGGRIVFENGVYGEKASFCGHYVSMYPALVNGEIDIRCPYFTTEPQYYHGTGTLKFASVQSHEGGSSAVTFGGGITVEPASWTTVTADAPDNFIKIMVTNSAVLSASANWTYGPAADVTPTTTAAERALTLAEGSTLLLRTGGYRISFADPIVGPGDVIVEAGSRFALAGDLQASAAGGWTTFATVASFTCAEGTYPTSLRFRTVDNGDGTVDVQARIIPGMVISIR